MKYLLKNGSVWSLDRCTKRDIFIDGDVIVDGFREDEADKIVDLEGLDVFPGFIDLHTHLREPGYSGKESVETGTKAAAKGGFTTVLAMPNTHPVLDSIWEMENFLKYLADKAVIRVLPVAPLTKSRLGKELADLGSLRNLGIRFASDDGNDIQSASLMRSALMYASDHGYTILSHAEEESLAKGNYHEGYLTRDYGIEGIPSSSEVINVARNLFLAHEVGAKIHFCHLSAKESVYLIKLGKELGVDVTAEVTPHHIYYYDGNIPPFNTVFKVNPPIRELEDRDCLREALQSGLIDALATDHAPHTEKEKAQNLNDAPFGISSIEVAVSVFYTVFKDRKLIYERLSKGPQKIIGETNELRVGDRADIAVFNPNLKTIVSSDNWISKGKNSPYFGETLEGQVTLTMQGGRIVHEQS